MARRLILIFSILYSMPITLLASEKCEYHKISDLGLQVKPHNCGYMTDDYQCYLQWEGIELDKSAGAITRNDKTLEITLNSGKGLVFKSNPVSGESFVTHWFIGKTENPDYFVVKTFGYESLSYNFISLEKGIELETSGVPVFSPDGSHFAIAEWGVESFNGVEIWEMKEDSSSKVFTYTPEWDLPFINMWGPSNALWVNDRTVQTEKCDGDFKKIGALYLSKKSNGWVLDETR